MTRFLTQFLYVAVCAGSLALAGSPAVAQGGPKDDDSNIFTDIGRWFDRSFSTIGDQFRDAGKGIDSFNREAGAAAKSTAEAASDAADAVVRLPKTRVVSGRQACAVADNGAPDCVTAANMLCRTRGLKSGTSLAVTSTRECPLRLARGSGEPRQCKDMTFVTRAMCQ
jgi:hypothetical protein